MPQKPAPPAETVLAQITLFCKETGTILAPEQVDTLVQQTVAGDAAKLKHLSDEADRAHTLELRRMADTLARHQATEATKRCHAYVYGVVAVAALISVACFTSGEARNTALVGLTGTVLGGGGVLVGRRVRHNTGQRDDTDDSDSP